MTELLTAAQMRAAELAAIDSGKASGLQLMERAGRGVVDAVVAHWPDLGEGARHAVVLCGPGNNGGDGFVVARRLRDRGWTVEVFFFGTPDGLSQDARKNHDVWTKMGEIQTLTVEAVGQGPRPSLLVDAMFGTGLSRAIPLDLALAHHAVEARDVGDTHPWLVPYRRVAVDCPSGLDCDTGKFLLPSRPEDVSEDDIDAQRQWWQADASKRLLRTDLTVTFHRKKVGHVLSDACGKVSVVDIGLGAEDMHPAHLIAPRASDRVMALDFDPPKGVSRRVWPGSHLDKRMGAGRHKYDHGHALILTGGAGKTGAARLAARGALRIGAGLVTLGVPGSAQQEVASQITALMLMRVGDGPDLDRILADERMNAVCLGPGLGLDRARDLVPVALGAIGQSAHPTRSVVLDADALTAFESDRDTFFEMLHKRCILTPHGGEFARLFPDLAETLSATPTKGPAFSKVDATREAARRAGCVVLFKGAETVIAAPDGTCSINAANGARAAPWLATAGSGDVLAGFITGLLARGMAPLHAAETAAWLHVECARSFGPGLIAEDLPETLPQVLRDLGV
ncbi:NAD(P)H-hydrate dehydratase [Roseovarius aestuariivivens]|uniref:NAD(P)H-hydrate dehydratase n=1 Tax=Roseovarius aestuariivivens TaxID=1888910 RepID=UPI001081FD93|nr:NAD(P)H-hydrate dehydratase [Roseovarius aestuariivivens]